MSCPRPGDVRRALPLGTGAVERPRRTDSSSSRRASCRPARHWTPGSGEGGDALWLAERGWHVTAVDFSTVALERAAAAAAARGLGERIEWVHADLGSWTPPEGSFDLVTAHYLHASWVDRSALFRRLAAAVAPGGTLLVVGHLLVEGDDDGHGHGHDGGVGDGRGQLHEHDPAAFYTAEEVMAALDPAQWQDVVTETRDRDPAAADRTGNHVPDTVLVAAAVGTAVGLSVPGARSGQERGRPRSARAAATAFSCSRSRASSRCTSTPRRVSRRSAARSRGRAEPPGRGWAGGGSSRPPLLQVGDVLAARPTRASRAGRAAAAAMGSGMRSRRPTAARIASCRPVSDAASRSAPRSTDTGVEVGGDGRLGESVAEVADPPLLGGEPGGGTAASATSSAAPRARAGRRRRSRRCGRCRPLRGPRDASSTAKASAAPARTCSRQNLVDGRRRPRRPRAGTPPGRGPPARRGGRLEDDGRRGRRAIEPAICSPDSTSARPGAGWLGSVTR